MPLSFFYGVDAKFATMWYPTYVHEAKSYYPGHLYISDFIKIQTWQVQPPQNVKWKCFLEFSIVSGPASRLSLTFIIQPCLHFYNLISNFYPGWRIVRLLHCELLIKHSSALTTHGLIQSDKTMCIPFINIAQGKHLCDKKGLFTHSSLLLTSTLIDGTPKVLFYGFLIRALELDFSRSSKSRMP